MVGSDADIIKMKVEGIEEIVHLYHEQYTDNEYYYGRAFAIKIGKLHYDLDGYCSEDREKVLKALHEALGIPKHQTVKMISLLFYPYSDDIYLNHIGDIVPLECDEDEVCKALFRKKRF